MKRELTDIQKEIAKKNYIKRAIENNIKKKSIEAIHKYYTEEKIEENIANARIECIKKTYMNKKIVDAAIKCATKHKMDAHNSGDKSQIAYQNCYTRYPNFVGTYEEFKAQIERKFKNGMG